MALDYRAWPAPQAATPGLSENFDPVETGERIEAMVRELN
jgi:hypothetical protein